MNQSQQFGLGSVGWFFCWPHLGLLHLQSAAVSCSDSASALQASVTFDVVSHLPLLHWPR